MEIRANQPPATVARRAAPVGGDDGPAPAAAGPTVAGDNAAITQNTEFGELPEVAMEDIALPQGTKGAAAAAAAGDNAAADKQITDTFKDILGRSPTRQELAEWRGKMGGGDKALRTALVNTPEFEQQLSGAWSAWGKANARTSLNFDPGRMKQIKEKVIKGDKTTAAIGFVYSGSALMNNMMAKYFEQVEKESQKRRMEGRA